MSLEAFGIVATVLLALIGVGVAMLAVPSHPDRSKGAKVFFVLAALTLAVVVVYWVISSQYSFVVRMVIDVVALGLTTCALVLGFQFADRSQIADLDVPAYAVVPEKFGNRLRGRKVATSALAVIVALVFINILFAEEQQAPTPAPLTSPSPTTTPESPKFEIHLGQAFFQYKKEFDITDVLLQVTVTNLGADSAVINWKAHYKSKTLDQDVMIFMPLREPVIWDTPGAQASLLFYKKDTIMMKTELSKVTRGLPIPGRMPIAIPGNREDEIRSGAIITITAYDYLQNPFSEEWKSGGKDNDGLMRILPGEETKPLRKGF